MAERHELKGSTHPAPRGMRPVGKVAGDEKITVSLYLKPRSDAAPAGDGVAPRAAIRQAREAAHAEDCAAIRAFAAEAGLAVVEESAARRLVKLSGPAAALEQAFGTELRCYEGDGQSVRGREGPLHLPASLADRVIAVLGLDTTPAATPKIVPHRGPTPPSGFLPSEVASLYGFAGAEAKGRCIALIELGGGFTQADNEAAFRAMGLAPPEIVAVGVDGGTNAPGDGSGADGEVALDIQVAGAVAPGARIAVYFAPNTSQGFVDAISQAVHDEQNKPDVLSISWGSPEDGWSGQAIAAMSAAFKDAVSLGVTVTAASGDSLATDGETDGQPHVDYPASDPSVLGCGGTRITASGDAIGEEVVWKSNGGGTGGGVSTLFARPDYQSGVTIPAPASAKGGRGVPDVAGNADPDSGYRIVTGGQTGIIGGTSAVAPLWAGIVAVLKARSGRALGQPHARLYASPDALRDIVRGDNKSGAIGYAAGPGWDACTGLGSPDGAKLASLFGGDAASARPGPAARAALLTVTGLDGSAMLIDPASIFRIRASIPSEGPTATRIEYGAGYLFTPEAIDALLARIGAAAHFVPLTTRAGTPVYLNAAAISSVRPALPANGPGTEIIIAGQYQHVTESVAAVQALLA
ncbi:S53 family peptidase [Sphingomonas morindae]|uniref:S53 family peptidase n=1 Tax=Sphingomonas morindae TaxID=1541170 RepID=A0ABY4X785_9SPHN|nr:S53 family peptidase [Sphingomonas morindae]USI72788.1 S53 family peptidase [Sphingomonas morindae]